MSNIRHKSRKYRTGACIMIFMLDIVRNSKAAIGGVFLKKAVLKNSAVFTGKHLCLSLFLTKLQAWMLGLGIPEKWDTGP